MGQRGQASDGRRVIDQEWVQVKLAECRARVEFLDLLNWKVAYESTVGNNVNPALASTIKVWAQSRCTSSTPASPRW